MEPDKVFLFYTFFRFFFLPFTICVLAQKIIAVSATTTNSSMGADGSLEIVKKRLVKLWRLKLTASYSSPKISFISPQRPPWGQTTSFPGLFPGKSPGNEVGGQRKVVVVVRWTLCMGM